MKIYITEDKANKVLRLMENKKNGIKEGYKSLSKSELILKEDVTSYLPTKSGAGGITKALSDAKDIFNKNPNVNSATTPGKNIVNQPDKKGVKVTIPANASPKQQSEVEKIASGNEVDVEITKSDTMSESVMFTKSELLEFLQTL